MPAPYLASCTRALSGTAGPVALFEAAAEAWQAEVGFLVLTVSRIHAPAMAATRVWSSCPAIFPAGQVKALDQDEWVATIMRERRPFVCADPAALRRSFFDHADLVAARCGSGINLPLVLNGQSIGTVNLFHEPHWFTPERIADATALLALMYAPFMLNGMP